MIDRKQSGDLLAMLVSEQEAMAEAAKGGANAAEFQAMLPRLSAHIDSALRAYGFDNPAKVRSQLQLPVQRMFRAREAAFDHILELARQDELDKRK